MTISVHQPQYISWIGYFNKMIKSDVFVYYDDCQYQNNGFQNRNMIANDGKYRWLTIPVSGHKLRKINEIEISYYENWQRKHIEIIKNNYKKEKYFDLVIDAISKYYKKEWKYLSEYIQDYDKELCKLIKIDAKIVRSSGLGFNDDLFATDRLIEICKMTNADTYFSGAGGKNYMELEKFDKEGIKVIFQEFIGQHQEVNPSIIDFLFKVGPEETKKIITNSFK